MALFIFGGEYRQFWKLAEAGANSVSRTRWQKRFLIPVRVECEIPQTVSVFAWSSSPGASTPTKPPHSSLKPGYRGVVANSWTAASPRGGYSLDAEKASSSSITKSRVL